MTIDVVGVDEINDLFKRVAPNHARALARNTVQGVAQEVVKEARSRAPIDKGILKKAIKSRRRRSPPSNPRSVVFITRGSSARYDAWYWRFIEYGTAGKTAQDARPFIKPSVEAIRSNINTIFRVQFGKKLESLLKRQKKKLNV